MKAALAVVVVLAGAGVGFALERTGVFSPIAEPVAASVGYEIPFYGCPGITDGDSGALGSFHGGDRVFITGRSADLQWLEVRAPFDVDDRVWVEGGYVSPDSDPSDLPVAECGAAPPESSAPAVETPESATTTPTPTTTTTTTTVPVPSSTTSTSRATTTTTTTTTTIGPPPPPPDTSGPIINFFQSDETDLWENGTPCAIDPLTAQVGGVVADPSGVDSVWIDWSVGTSVGMTAASELAPNIYFAEIGPFPVSTISGAPQPIFLRITAYDSRLNETTVSSSSLTVLHDCTIG